MGTRTRRRGRAPMRWFDGRAAIALPRGTAVVIDPGSNRARLRGRIVKTGTSSLTLDLGARTTQLFEHEIARARVVNSRFEDGDLVLRIGVPESDWRGGVVTIDGFRIYVESTDGFGWIDEADLELAVARDPEPLPRLAPGPIPPALRL